MVPGLIGVFARALARPLSRTRNILDRPAAVAGPRRSAAGRPGNGCTGDDAGRHGSLSGLGGGRGAFCAAAVEHGALPARRAAAFVRRAWLQVLRIACWRGVLTLAAWHGAMPLLAAALGMLIARALIVMRAMVAAP